MFSGKGKPVVPYTLPFWSRALSRLGVKYVTFSGAKGHSGTSITALWIIMMAGLGPQNLSSNRTRTSKDLITMSGNNSIAFVSSRDNRPQTLAACKRRIKSTKSRGRGRGRRSSAAACEDISMHGWLHEELIRDKLWHKGLCGRREIFWHAQTNQELFTLQRMEPDLEPICRREVKCQSETITRNQTSEEELRIS